MTELQPRRLDGWKAIGAYLDKSERTVMRWRRERGLPVHGIPGEHGSVCAFAHELEEWLRRQSPDNSTEVPASEEAGASPGVALPADTADLHLVRALAVGPQRRSHWTAGASMSMAVLIVLVAWLLLRANRRPAYAPARAELRGHEVVAWDREGRRLWGYLLPEEVRRVDGLEKLRPAFKQQVRLADLEGDGRPEVLVVAASPRENAPEPSNESLYCLSHDGRLLWRYQPHTLLRFAGRRFEPPWRTDSIMVAEGTADVPGSIYVAYAHVVWWPSFIVRLGLDGRATVVFVQSGHIHAMRRQRGADGRFLLLAGGINNEYGAASVAVLAEDAPPASSPQTAGSGYRCDDCPPARPQRYIVLPRPELAVLAGGPYNSVFGFASSGSNVVALVSEIWDNGPLGDVAWSVYELSARDLVPLHTWALDGYWAHHRALETEGILKHTAAACPERGRARRVAVWEPSVGWSTVNVPWAEPLDAMARTPYLQAELLPERSR